MIGVIFDFNGTLFNDSAKHEKAWQVFSGKVFRRSISQEEFKRFIHGRLTLDVKLLLGELKERQIPMTIATASPKINMEYYIKKFHLEKWFDIEKIIYNDGTIPGKPNPDLYVLAAGAIHVEPKDCIVFEDAISGIQAAYNAGVRKIIAVVPREQENQFEKLPGVCDVISSFHRFDRFFLRE